MLFQQSNATQEIKLSFLHFFGKRVQITDNQGFVYIRQSGRQKKTFFFFIEWAPHLLQDAFYLNSNYETQTY